MAPHARWAVIRLASTFHALLTGWEWHPVLVPLLLVTAVGYVAIWRRARRSLGALFAWEGGTLAIVLATCSPLDALADARFAPHMVQHELLMFVAAPLFVAGMQPVTLALLRYVRARIARWGHAITRPRVAWIISTVVLWAWHWPPAYDFALAHSGVHDLQHAMFLAASVLYWSPFAAFGHAVPALRSGAARTLYLATGGAQSAVLGAVLAFGPAPLYLHYVAAAGPERALGDEQLGGMVMLLSGAIVFAIAAVVTTSPDE